MPPAVDAVSAYTTAAAVPGADLHQLAGLLLNLTVAVSSTNRPVEAIAPVRAAVDMLRSVAPAPGASAPIRNLFAVALHTLALKLFEAHQPEAAVAPAREAVTAFREVAGVRGADLRHIAGQLFTLSGQMSANAPPAEAVASIDAAVDIFRPVASAPDATAADRSLFGVLVQRLAVRLIEAGRRDEALPPAQEAVRVYRRLAAEDPAAFASNLASAESLVASLTGG
jgi:hypothetical protein